MCVCVCVCGPMCAYVCMCLCVCAHVYVFICICAFVYAYVYAYACVCVYDTHAYVCTPRARLLLCNAPHYTALHCTTLLVHPTPPTNPSPNYTTSTPHPTPPTALKERELLLLPGSKLRVSESASVKHGPGADDTLWEYNLTSIPAHGQNIDFSHPQWNATHL